MPPTDIAELRRLHEAATKGVFWQEEVAFGEACKANLPALLDELEAAREEVRRLQEAVTATTYRDLEAEMAVRDNSANEVLRILREATGRRDFHSEMEAAEWAAKMILDLQTQLFLEKQSSKDAMSREAAAVSREIGARAELAEARLDSARLDAAERGKFSIRNNAMSDKWEVTTGDIHPAYRRSVSKKTLRAAIDAAMKEAK